VTGRLAGEERIIAAIGLFGLGARERLATQIHRVAAASLMLAPIPIGILPVRRASSIRTFMTPGSTLGRRRIGIVRMFGARAGRVARTA
jgi:hypothetical protein